LKSNKEKLFVGKGIWSFVTIHLDLDHHQSLNVPYGEKKLKVLHISRKRQEKLVSNSKTVWNNIQQVFQKIQFLKFGLPLCSMACSK
jgi:hypothetical protein